MIINKQSINPRSISERLKSKIRRMRVIRRPRIAPLPSSESKTAELCTIDMPLYTGGISLALGMITTERKVSTILPTIKSIRAAGFKEPLHIFTQTSQVAPDVLTQAATNIHVHYDQTVCGCYPNWKKAAQWLVNNTNSTWIMIMQDDIDWCAHGARIMYESLSLIDSGKSGIKKYRLGLLSPYTSPAMVPEPLLGCGWTEARFYGKMKGLWGALALCFPREALENLLMNHRFVTHDSNRALDYIVGDSLRHHSEPPLGVKVHVPSLVEHTGDHSTVFAAEKVNNVYINKLRHGYRYSKDPRAWGYRAKD